MTRNTVRVRNLDGQTVSRAYYTHVVGKASRTVFCFHGSMHEPLDFATMTGLIGHPLVKNTRFVFLEGSPSSVLKAALPWYQRWSGKYDKGWNSGPRMARALALEHVNEVEYILAVQQATKAMGITALGYSNGAMMAGNSGMFSRVILVAGIPEVDVLNDVPLIHHHGWQDAHAPLFGGLSYENTTGYVHRSATEFWATRATALLGEPIKPWGVYRAIDEVGVFNPAGDGNRLYTYRDRNHLNMFTPALTESIARTIME